MDSDATIKCLCPRLSRPPSLRPRPPYRKETPAAPRGPWGRSRKHPPHWPHRGGSSRSPAATGPHSTCCALSCPPPPGALPPAAACQELTAGHTCAAAAWACQHHAWLQGRWPVPSDNQRRQTWPAPQALGHPCGVQSCLSWPALHLTRPPWGRRSCQQAVQGGYSGRQAGTLGTWPVSTSPSPSTLGLRWSVTGEADQRPWLRGGHTEATAAQSAEWLGLGMSTLKC